MRKRRELDALVSGGKLSGRCGTLKKGCSAHELLRHETESSDTEDFSILQNPRRKGRKKHGNRLCLTSVCLSLIQFVLVTSCCLVSGALIWLHIGLRQDIDLLRAHLQKVEAGNRNTPEALHVTYSKLRLLDSNVSTLFTEVRKNIAAIENITSELKQLKGVTNDLKESIAAAPALQELPKNVKTLSESVANFGSKMNALESNLKELKDQQSGIQTTAQNLSGELDSLKALVQELSNATDSKSPGNSSSKDKLQSTVAEVSQHVSDFEGKLVKVADSVDKINSTMSLYKELPSKVETINEAIAVLVNDSQSADADLKNLKTFINSNMTLRLEQLESEAVSEQHILRSSIPSNSESINKAVSQTVLQLINQHIFNRNLSHLQSLEQTHDVLVLLAALLEKFDRIPRSLLNDHNATVLVDSMLHEAFEAMMYSRDQKIQSMEIEIKNVTSCLIGTSNIENKSSEDLITPFILPASKDNASSVTPPL